MQNIVTGNDFTLIVDARRQETASQRFDLRVLERLEIYLVMAGRAKVLQSYTLDELGRAVIEVGGDVLPVGVWGVELVGTYQMANVRSTNAKAFKIVDGLNQLGLSGDGIEIVVEVNVLSNAEATRPYVDAAIADHDADVTSHSDIRTALAQKVSDIKVDGISIVDGNKVANLDSDDFGKVDDVKVNGVSVVSNKEAAITMPTKVSDLANDSQFTTKSYVDWEVAQAGHVDDVQVNGTSVVSGKVASVTIPTKVSDLTNDADYRNATQVQSAINTAIEANLINDGVGTVDGTTGTPSVDIVKQGTTLHFDFHNIKGAQGDRGEKGETGETGAQGATSVYAQTTQDFLTTLETTTGQSQTKTMTQKAVTDAIDEGKIVKSSTETRSVPYYNNGTTVNLWVDASDGQFKPLSAGRSIELELTPDMKTIRYNATKWNNYNGGYAFVKDNGTYISGAKTTEAGNITIDAATPISQGATKFRCCLNTDAGSSISLTIYSETLEWPKKYTETGSNEDGWMTQKAVTDAVTDAISDIQEISEVIAFQQGGINTSGAEVDTDNIKPIRIRSEWVSSKSVCAIRITPSGNQKFYWYKYDLSKNFIDSSGAWLDSPLFLSLEENRYYRFCVMKGNNEAVSFASLSVNFSFVYYNCTKDALLKDIESAVEGVDICKVVPMRKLGISTTDELKINDIRVSIIDHIKFHSGVKLLLKPNGQKMYWYEYDSSKSLISQAGSWLTSDQYLDVTDGHYYRFGFGKLDDSSIAVDEVTANIIITKHVEDTTKAENLKLSSLFEPAFSAKYIFGKGKIWEYPMNTIEAYEAAGQDSRCWAIVGDVQYTSDGYYVMYHDRSLVFNGVTTTINDLTYAQVQTIVIEDGGEQYTVPTLDQFLAICRRYGKLPIFEIKAKISALNWTTSEHTQDMVNIIEKARGYGMLDTLCIIAQPDDLSWLASNYPNVGKMRLCNYDVSASGKYDAYISPTIDDPQYIYLSYPQLSAYPDAMGTEIITRIHNSGRKCVAYGPRPVPDDFVENCINLNFDAILLYSEPI